MDKKCDLIQQYRVFVCSAALYHPGLASAAGRPYLFSSGPVPMRTEDGASPRAHSALRNIKDTQRGV